MDSLEMLNARKELQQQQPEIQINMEPQQEEMEKQFLSPEMAEQQKQKEREQMKKGHALANKMKESYAIKNREYAKLNAPLTSELHSEYGETFKDKSMMKSRESKIKNKKSRLYKKDQAAKRFEAMDAGEFKMRDKRAKLRRNIPEEERLNLNCSETKDLSMLASMLTTDDKTMESKFSELVGKYSGFKEVKGEDGEIKREEMSAEEKEAARFDVMAEVANELLSNNMLDTINLFDDESLSKNAAQLERLTSMTAIFNRMLAANPGFMEALNLQTTAHKRILDEKGNLIREKEVKVTAGGITAEVLTKQLERLQAVSDVYRVRKLIVTNPYYRAHYNEELSMNASLNSSPEQKYLAKLLRTSFYLGKNLQKYGTSDNDINDASMRLNAEGNFAQKQESRICKISADPEDYINSTEYQNAMKSLHGSAFDKKDKEIRDQIAKTRRENTEALLIELEHEKYTMPEESMKFDLKNVSKKKFDKKNFVLSNPTTTYVYYMAHREKSPREDESNENSLKSKVKKLLNQKGEKGSPISTNSIGVNSERLGNHEGGDQLSRQVENFTGQFVENMTDEEVLEMIDGLTYSKRKEEKNRTPEQQKMAEDMYLSNYLIYTNTVHQAMRKIMNTMGDNITTLHSEDWARLQSNPRFAVLVGVMSSISSNMEVNLPYEFLKKFSGQPVEHLKDFYMLSRAVSGCTFVADLLRQDVADKMKNREGDCNEIKKEAKQKLTEVQKEIKKKLDEGTPETSPEIKELRKKEALYSSEEDRPDLVLMDREIKNVEEFRKKKFTDEFDDEKEDNIYSLNKESNSETLGLQALRELEMLKHSAYWEYNKTSEKEKEDYKKSLKSRGVPECYDMEIAKKICLDKLGETIKAIANLKMKAEQYGLETTAVEENMDALVKTIRSFGYTDDQLSSFLDGTWKKTADSMVKDEESIESLKKEGKEPSSAFTENVKRGQRILSVLDDLANRLGLEVGFEFPSLF